MNTDGMQNGNTTSLRDTPWIQRLADWVFGYDFFIAYAWEDGRAYAKELANQLIERKYACFLDSKEFQPGQALNQATVRALGKTRVLVLVGSPAAPERSAVGDELSIFSKTGRRIVPIDIGGLGDSTDASKIKQFLPSDVLYILEDPRLLSKGPSKETVIQVLRSLDGISQDKKRSRLVMGTLATLSALLMAAVAAAAIAFDQRDNALEQQRIAIAHANRSQANLAVSLGSQSLATDPANSLALGLHSLELSPTPAARSLISEAIRSVPVYDEWRHPSANDATSGEITLLHNAEPALRTATAVPHTEAIAILDRGGSLYLWNPSLEHTNPKIASLRSVDAISMAADRNHLGVLEKDGDVALLEVEDTLTVKELGRLEGNHTHAVVSTDGQRLAGLGDGTTIGLLANNERFEIHVDEPSVAGAFSLDGERLFAVSNSGELTVWHVDTGERIATVHTNAIEPRNPGFAVLDHWEQILQAQDELEATEAESERKVEEATADDLKHQTDILGFPVPQLTLSGTMTNMIMGLLMQDSGEQSPNVRLYPGLDSASIILVADDGYTLDVEVWDVDTGRLVFSERGLFSKASVRADGSGFALVTPSASSLFTLERNGDLQVEPAELWSPERGPERLGEPVGVWHSPLGHYIVTAHSPALMLIGARPSSVSLWYAEAIDSRDGDPHRGHRLKPDGSQIVSVDFSSQGNQVITADSDGTVRVWKIAKEAELFDPAHPERIAQFIFSNLRYTPEEALDFLTTRFRTDTAIARAAKRVSTEALDAAEAAALGLSPLTGEQDLDPPANHPIRYSWDVAVGFDENAGEYDPTYIDELRELMDDTLREDLSDTAFGARYAAIVPENPLLLSGLQIRWASRILQDEHEERFADAIMVLGMSGDRSAAEQLEALDLGGKVDPEALGWARGFLRRQARDTSVLETRDPKSVNMDTFLVYPKVAAPHLHIESMGLEDLPPSLQGAARRHHGGDPEVSMASLVFAIAVTGQGRSRLLQSIGEIKRDNAESEEAWAYAAEATAADPSSVGAWNLWGNLHADTGRHDEAIEAFKKCLELGRIDGWPEYNMALSYEAIGDLKTADRQYQASLTRRDSVRRPEELAVFLNGLASFLLTSATPGPDTVQEAYDLSVEANELSSQANPIHLDTLALAVYRLGRVEEAVSIQRSAISFLEGGSKDSAEYQERLAEYERAAGNVTQLSE